MFPNYRRHSLALATLLVLSALSIACASAPHRTAPRATAPHATAPPVATPASSGPKRLQPALPWDLELPAGTTLEAATLDMEGELVFAMTLKASHSFLGTNLSRGLWLLKLGPDQSLRWSQNITSNPEAFAYALVSGDDGSYSVAGSFAKSISLAGARLQSRGDRDAFIASFENDGSLRWMHSFGGAAREAATSLALDRETGRLSVGGWAESRFQFAGKTHNGRGTAKDGFVVSYERDGTQVWAWRYVGVGIDRVDALTYDYDELVVFGSFSRATDLGGHVVRSLGDQDLFAARYDTSGHLLRHKSLGSPKREHAVAITRGPDNTLFFTAESDGDLRFGDETEKSLGATDLVLWAEDSTGTVIAHARLGDASNNRAAALLSENDKLLLLGESAASGAFEAYFDLQLRLEQTRNISLASPRSLSTSYGQRLEVGQQAGPVLRLSEN